MTVQAAEGRRQMAADLRASREVLAAAEAADLAAAEAEDLAAVS